MATTEKLSRLLKDIDVVEIIGETDKNITSLQSDSRKAEKDGVTSVYSALVNQSVPIEYNDYFRDTETGITYRVTSNPEEKAAPRSAGAIIKALKFFTAERKELPK